jgi:hypothetical protein
MSRHSIRPLWLVVALALFASDLAMHLPVSDFFDFLAKRFGFFEYDAATKQVFIAIGALGFAALWFYPGPRRRAVRVGTMTLAVLMVAAQSLLLVTAIENIHYPQYALLGMTLVRAGLGLEGAWLAAGGFGLIDEAYQHAVLPRGVPGYLDANDIVLNGIGAALGVVVVVALSRRASEAPLIAGRRLVAVLAVVGMLALLAGPLVPSPFFSVTPGGRRFHLLSPFEAIVVLGFLWQVVRRLAAEPIQGFRSEPYRRVA